MGGGSLIYANVLAPPPPGWLRGNGRDGAAWPVDEEDLTEHFESVKELLRPTTYPDVPPFSEARKTQAFREAAAQTGLEVDGVQPELAIQFRDDAGNPGIRQRFGEPDDNYYGFPRLTCEMAGECDIGCNVGAKHTLDLAVLSAVERCPDVEVREFAEARAIRRIDGGFAVDVLDHSAAARDADVEPVPRTVTCGRLVLAAGALGTALLLLRSRLRLRGLSAAVGRGFSANGDYLAFAADCRRDGEPPIEPWRGPVITASARGRDEQDGGDGPGFHLQDGGFPGWAGWAAQVAGMRRDLLRFAMEARTIVEGPAQGHPAENLGHYLSDLIDGSGERLLPILSIGRDAPAGRLHLRGRRLDLDWRKDESTALYERAASAAQAMARALGGRYADPLRYMRPITVHPLGGCAMSRDSSSGVVDEHCCVHHIDGLSIADGSVLPGPVGINPALTIAALGDRHGKFLVESGKPKL
jgi:cholesterol oxidase